MSTHNQCLLLHYYHLQNFYHRIHSGRSQEQQQQRHRRQHCSSHDNHHKHNNQQQIQPASQPAPKKATIEFKKISCLLTTGREIVVLFYRTIHGPFLLEKTYKSTQHLPSTDKFHLEKPRPLPQPSFVNDSVTKGMIQDIDEYRKIPLRPKINSIAFKLKENLIFKRFRDAVTLAITTLLWSDWVNTLSFNNHRPHGNNPTVVSSSLISLGVDVYLVSD
uniref:Uncharacterized protein n=1 Tax=Glossina brevipalpis TaxID=37001 RepID=A0A1A9W9U6_9MUSC